MALERELRERMAVSCEVGALVLHVSHSYTAYDLDMRVYRVRLAPDACPRAIRVHQIRWVPEDDLPNYPFPGADQQTVDALLMGDRGAGQGPFTSVSEEVVERDHTRTPSISWK